VKGGGKIFLERYHDIKATHSGKKLQKTLLLKKYPIFGFLELEMTENSIWRLFVSKNTGFEKNYTTFCLNFGHFQAVFSPKSVIFNVFQILSALAVMAVTVQWQCSSWGFSAVVPTLIEAEGN